MRICLVHNRYGRPSGEEVIVSRIGELLHEYGHDVYPYFRSSSEINGSLAGQLRAFFSGIYSFSSRKRIRQIINDFKPDVIQIQNLYPLISPSVLVEAKKHNVPVVMHCANYRLICPNGLFLSGGEICEKCAGGREWWCFLHNCEQNRFKSLGYCLRNYIARTRRYFLDNVTIYYAQTEFQRRRLIQEGFPADKVYVVPNMVTSNQVEVGRNLGQYVCFVGRISPEKDISTLMEAAKICPDIQFKIAGAYDRLPQLLEQAPENFELCGYLEGEQLKGFYADSRIFVLCSICYEGFPSVLLEAMLHGKPVICSRIGGLTEIVDDGVTGFLFEPGNADDLTQKIRYLWDRPELCHRMGQAARRKVLQEYSPQKYYKRLMSVYSKAIEFGSNSHS